MEDNRFWFEKSRNEKEISRELEHNLYNDDIYPTVQQPQSSNYDPWADWFNAGLDPEPFTDNFSAGPEQGAYYNYGVNPSYYPAEYGQSVPWDQVQNPPWFDEGAEKQGPTEELPVSEGQEQFLLEQEEGNLFRAKPEVLLEEEQPAAPSGAKGEEKGPLVTDYGLPTMDSPVNEGESLVGETEDEAETRSGMENQFEEETMDKKENMSKEEIKGEEAIEHKTESLSRESKSEETEKGKTQDVIVWREFPAKSV
ncbi:MAG TPA: hypothetical protein GXZ98_04930 [Firmicutes bacterium]|jgi:hypothetical protein|nr:hypothetical protein [Bacillota bacterium]